MITPANPRHAANPAGSISFADAVTPVCTAVVRGDEEGVSEGSTSTERSAVATCLLSQVKRMDIVIDIDSLLPPIIWPFFSKQEKQNCTRSSFQENYSMVCNFFKFR
jgi:hypothetical protein